ncbi:alpha amylase catalytic region [Chlorobaculum parvum NCIB 8327]|uniref:Alpha amylase catalytic region n=1 Tax=Chlorobaculum parvum (strain DSM 263 / NCIMB 8327) TaxID=517417 RepID=B3QQC2_CHLP8|nr:alpha-amylase family glycosyl hydrolase [Chlorobaculum parvum]ACF12125.1 alpha amylase catalytic region [Chlorobaculum parvum NCIB 8327]
MSTDIPTSIKEHFYISKAARNRYRLDDPALLRLPQDRQEAMKQSERQTEAINHQLSLVEGDKAKKLLPAQFHGMKLLHELQHHVIDKVSGLHNQALAVLDREASNWNSVEYLGKFVERFPTGDIYRSKTAPETWLKSAANRANALEEAYLVWLNNRNPALKQFAALISDRELHDDRAYPQLVKAMQHAVQSVGPVGDREEDLEELLTRPFRHAPDSLLDQLRFIKLHWSDLLAGSPWLELLDETIVLIEDEDRYLFFENLSHENAVHGGMFGEQEVHSPSYDDLGDAPARYSHDSSWMPEVVMIAKSTYVWLDQLSRQYGRHIARLQDIPDEELDMLADRGFTALWLIGLWERSYASRKIKQLQGNPEAKASAYALESYEIAHELGGYDGYVNLRNRAMQRGIRLASDMVPNHTGIDSELVRNRPDWFLSTGQPPYPNYTYNGPNLSEDSRYGIHIEDGYWNRSDAAVTFKRVDHMTGDTRYIYHGNDGTTMPWNDTAQLNFLDPEVREGVIQQILHVARMFPVIRFDAAMVLAKMHIQRLWFPLHGHAPGIPSRGAWSMSMAEFEAAMPQEFWREVVDRVAQEVPDTLLLAEAFWMLEGYFVRTLGMHRVYNSAFMHMLKKEDNAGYRGLIKKTLEFDAEILKRYVNFMNNPDEDTAIAQFGRGDKYFGVCMMMLTMPGLPMIGHGQVEGFTEKYGMEYAKAYYDERPDEELVGRHYREIFPVMKQRSLFAEVAHFQLFDLYAPDGQVNENVFAYSNQHNGKHSLFIYNNRYEASEGWIRISAGRLDNGSMRQTSLGDALSLPGEHHSFVIFRDQRSGLEFIRSCALVREQGLFVALGGYQYNLFMEFRVVRPSKLKPYDQVCEELNGRGVASIEIEALSISLRPIHQIVEAAIEGFIEKADAKSAKPEKLAAAFGKACQTLLDAVAERFAEIMEKQLTPPNDIAEKAAESYLSALGYESLLEKAENIKRVQVSLGLDEKTDKAFCSLAKPLIALNCIQEMVRDNGLLEKQVIDQWLLGNTLEKVFAGKSGDWPVNSSEAVDLISCLLARRTAPGSDETPDEQLMASIRTLHESGDKHFKAFMQVQYLHGKEWFRERQLSLLASWIMVQELIWRSENIKKAKQVASEEASVLTAWLDAIDKLEMAAFVSGYELGSLLKKGN